SRCPPLGLSTGDQQWITKVGGQIQQLECVLNYATVIGKAQLNSTQICLALHQHQQLHTSTIQLCHLGKVHLQAVELPYMSKQLVFHLGRVIDGQLTFQNEARRLLVAVALNVDGHKNCR